MRNRRFGLFIVIGLLSLFATISAYARPFIIVSAAPPMRADAPPPGGYVSCYTVPPAFYEGVWINAHRVCEYDSMPGGGMWVSGYWQCVHFRHTEGVCLDWGWMPSHWANPEVAEYGVRWSNYHHFGHYGYNHYDHHGYHSAGPRWN